MLRLIRKKIDSMLLPHHLRQIEGLIVLEKNVRGLIFKSVRIRFDRYFFWIIPLYKIEREYDYNQIPFDEGLSGPLSKIAKTLDGHINNSQKTLWDTVTKSMVSGLSTTVGNLRDTFLKKLMDEYKSFHNEFFSDVFKKSHREYRKSVTEAIKLNCTTLLSEGAKRMIASIQLKILKNQERCGGQGIMSSSCDALPNNCRFVFRRGGVSTFVIEQSPTVRTIVYRKSTFRIAMPYVVFMVTLCGKDFHSMRMFFRNSPLRNEEDELCCPALPNISSDDYHVCFPYPKERNQSPTVVVESALQNYWGSEFNSDLRVFFEKSASLFPQLSTLDSWQENSRRDPGFVLNLPWESTNMSVASAAKRAIDTACRNYSEDEESLNDYINTVSQRLASETTEKLHFMVSHTSTEDITSLPLVEAKFAKLVQGKLDDLKNDVNKMLTVRPGKKLDDVLCAKAREALSANLAQEIAEFNQRLQERFKEL